MFLLTTDIFPNIFMFFPIIILSFVFVYFTILIVNSRKKLPIEEGRIPLLELKCTGWIGAFRYTYPFVRVRFYEEIMVIGYRKRIIFYYDELVGITYKQYFRVLAKGIAFIHNRKDIPQRVILFFINNSIILDFLKDKIKTIE